MILKNSETSGKYLTLVLAGETYAVAVEQVDSVLDETEPTAIPGTDESMLGIIHLRDSILPVVDMKGMLGVRPDETEKAAVNRAIVVLHLDSREMDRDIGILVDDVLDVVTLDPDNLQQAPGIGMTVDRDYVQGIAKDDRGFLILLDVQKVFSRDDFSRIKKAAVQGANRDGPESDA